MITKPPQSCPSVIQAMVEHLLENQEQILAQSSGQVVLDYSRLQVAYKLIPKATYKKILAMERVKL